MSLVERTDSLTLLGEMARENADKPSRVVLVRGPVATGKSELLNHVAEEAETAGVMVLAATGLRAERRTPMAVFAQLLLGGRLPQRETERVEKLLDDARFTAMLRDCDSEREEHVKTHVMRSLTSTLASLAQERPLAVIVDDTQYADIPSLQCLQYAMRDLRTKPVLIVLAASTGPRPARPLFGAELLRHPRLTELRTSTLSERAVAGILEDSLCDAAARGLAPAAHRATGGNPLLVRALVHDLRTDDGDGRDGPRTSGTPVTGHAYQQAVLGCLYRSEPEVLAAARGLAVLDRAATEGLLADLLDLAPDMVVPSLRELEATGLVEREGERRSFRHPAARDAVLSDMEPAERVSLHRRAADRLRRLCAEPQVVARHIVASGHVDDAQTVDVLCEAARRARGAEDASFAVACLQLADRACGNGPRRSAILGQLTRLVERLSPTTAGSCFTAMRTAFDEGWLADQETPLLIKGLLWQGNFQDAADVAHKSRGVYGSRSTAETYLASGAVRTTYPALREHFLPDDSSTPPPVLGNDAIAARGADPAVKAGTALQVILTKGCDAGAADRAEHLLQGTRLSDVTLEPLLGALSVLVYADRLAVAAHWCDALLGEATRLGGPGWQAQLSESRARIALRQGNPADAIRYATDALGWMPAHHWGVALGSLLATLVAAHTAMGEYEKAEAYLDGHVPDLVHDTCHGLELVYARGQYYAATNRPHPALDDFLTCGERMQRWGVDQPSLVPWRSAAAEMHLRTGGKAEAEKLAQEQLAKCGPGQSRTRAQSLRVMAEAAGLRRHHHLLREAVEALEPCEDRLELVRVLGALSRSHHALGELGQARMMARRAWHIARDTQAEALCSQLLPYGGENGPEQQAAAGESSATELTDAERRVASLASFGHSNREIARKLFITVSTVEQHLTRVYRKLNVSRRRDLPHDLLADTAC
ncbi:AAA family ATPase [Streptomyces sp. NPDC017890]|uniref:helix-turn-helix transcriptional regulator n=1 Tax=Streptomyces sp. NPDC017890 TaxID=3365015 RepID=UPI0037B7C78C